MELFNDVRRKSGILSLTALWPSACSCRSGQRRLAGHLRCQRSTASALYQNKKNGTFFDRRPGSGLRSQCDGKPQAGMGISAADYDLDAISSVKTNFAGDTPSLYHNLGGAKFETPVRGASASTRNISLGLRFFRHGQGRWPDILLCNWPRLSRSRATETEAATHNEKAAVQKSAQRGASMMFSNDAGPGISTPVAARGCAFGDFDQRRRPRCGRQHRERFSAASALRFTQREQLDQDQNHRHEVNRRRAPHEASNSSLTHLPGEKRSASPSTST